jgi:hypothetical protein
MSVLREEGTMEGREEERKKNIKDSEDEKKEHDKKGRWNVDYADGI